MDHSDRHTLKALQMDGRKKGSFPEEQHCYHMLEGEKQLFLEQMQNQAER